MLKIQTKTQLAYKNPSGYLQRTKLKIATKFTMPQVVILYVEIQELHGKLVQKPKVQ
jgi:hypothetical protein